MANTPKKSAAPKGAGRTAFLAVKGDVVNAIKAGHSTIDIYTRLKSRLGISYSQFARYVATHVPPSDPGAPRGAGRVAFIAAKEEIAQLIASGLPLREIYEGIGDRLGIGYPQFTRYVSRFLSSPASAAQATPARPAPVSPSGPSAGKPAAQSSSSTPEKKQSPILRKFIHDPSPKKDDLI